MIGEFSRSIRLKLVGIILVAVLVATLLAGAGAAWRETSRRFELRKESLTAVASALASSVAVATRAGDRRAIAAGLSAIRTMPGIEYAIVVDATGRRLHEIGSGVVLGSPADAIKANRELGLLSTVRLGTYVVGVPVVHGGEPVGQLAVIANVSELRRALVDSIIGALVTGSLASVIAMLIAGWLQGSITAPILALTRVADHVRTTGDFSVPAPKLSVDETGQLVDAFNTMMSEVSQRDGALKRHRDNLAREVEQRTRDLAAAKDAAERANAAKSDFLATMSHEIRTPMNGMLVMAELLAADDLGPKARRRCEVIVKSGQVLLTLINDVLDLSKIEAGRLELERIPCDPSTIVDDVAQLFAGRAASSGLVVACRFGPSVPRSVLADPLRLRQIVTNLVSNALKFTETGGISLGIDTVMRESGQLMLQFTVEDTGIGIPKDKLAAIFEAFTQADASTTRRFGGTGIGLTICRQLATAMGGNIMAESEEGRGSTFRLEIPAEVLEAALPSEPGSERAAGSIVPPELAVPHDEAAAPDALGEIRVLAADDDPVNREVLGEVLVRLGARVTMVESGAEAIKRRQAERFDIVFMDGSMPGMDGFEASRRIRAWEERTGAEAIPIVALTAHALGPQAQLWRQCGMNDHIAKPFTIAAIRGCIDRWIGSRMAASKFGEHMGGRDAGRNDLALLDAEVLRNIQTLEQPGDNLVRRVIDLYCSHAPKCLGELAACSADDTASTAEAAHALKSLSRNVGATCVATLCDRLENDARSGRKADGPALKELASMLAATIDELRRSYPSEAACGDQEARAV